jgi:hypothetical protein
MKLICVCLFFAILLTGCYSHTTITKDDPFPHPAVEVSFQLHDGRHILSHEYQRVENGYTIVGKLIYNDNKHSKDFSGIVPDDQIKNVVTNEFSKASTVSAVVATVLGIAVALGLAVHSRF